ncbi:GMC oxidoreductase [Colletotrichum higginsianum]|uniref:GMC oxidoreductase n=2 Tax=Colletotrichum higginsianum TaxID=80884 RepID=H1V2N5_COLHI|nr:GMC oxidoreductase [Colletotrichum higginsianum IMI 349063]OBR13314.1 GMC oxidoreductase [Colletotrichum higginsianum IMI 349063]CCF34487.1 GMC oxidoreductase [Colletotrichum higginsianum]
MEHSWLFKGRDAAHEYSKGSPATLSSSSLHTAGSIDDDDDDIMGVLRGFKAAALTALISSQFHLSTAAPASAKFARRNATSLSDSYDYVIVGGGLSGLVVANRLTEDPEVTVLVVEYGDFDDSWDVAIPYYSANLHPNDLIQFMSVPQPGLNNRTSGVQTGTVVGGGSTVNGMAFDRGSKGDYDAWEELGNPGWNWESLSHYFKKSTTFTLPAPEYVERYNYSYDESTYGDGPVQVGFPSWQWPDRDLQREAWINDVGVPVLDDHGAGGNNVGLALLPQNHDPKNVTRSTSRTAYYDPVAGTRKNLNLLVKHFASTIEFENKKAVGVNIVSRDTNATTLIKAKKEVVLAAGGVQTPRILLQSGVGPASLLESLDIDVVADLPGVGANYQDHPWMLLLYTYGNPPELGSEAMNDPAFFNASEAEYFANRTGPFTHARGNNIIFLSLQDITSEFESLTAAVEAQNAADFLPPIYSEHPELLEGFLAQRESLAKLYRSPEAGVLEIPFGGFSGGAISFQKPLSRGTVTINTTNPNPAVPPVIDFGVLQNPIDLDVAVLSVKAFRKVWEGPTLAVREAVEIVPGANVTSDEAIAEAIRDSLFASFAHPSGTTSLQPLEHGGVVDPELRVYGVEGLRVVDSSIIPLIPACHLQSTVYAVAEKASDILKGL